MLSLSRDFKMARTNSPRNHVLRTPIYIPIIRAFQLLFAVILLGLSAYGVSQAYYDGFGATLFTVSPGVIAVLLKLYSNDTASLSQQ